MFGNKFVDLEKGGFFDLEHVLQFFVKKDVSSVLLVLQIVFLNVRV
jgi:hypothetical protein